MRLVPKPAFTTQRLGTRLPTPRISASPTTAGKARSMGLAWKLRPSESGKDRFRAGSGSDSAGSDLPAGDFRPRALSSKVWRRGVGKSLAPSLGVDAR